MWIWRRMEKVSWTKHITNDERSRYYKWLMKLKTIANNNNKRKTEELGGARIKRRLPPERNHRRENGMEKREGKTEADDAQGRN